jgi:multicomponent K+:H+ antiporter subunit A
VSLALIAALPFLGALLPGVMTRRGHAAIAAVTALVTASTLALILWHMPAVLAGKVVRTDIAWLPQLGLNAHFMLDGLGLLFALLILGMGLLVILYARFYLSDTDPKAQFYSYLLLFQGAMLGIVLSDNILLLLVFWELTSLSSFLLIGYWRHLPAARSGARMALAVTGAGGLSLIAGLLILGTIAGSYDLSVILTQGTAIQASPLYLPALILILLGAFTKSAQFPFHFWLPHAMAAPTPVSAYLHSATMVKAGIFLLARLWPVLSGTEAWVQIVTTVGLLTMALGAVVALFKDDLKAVLAYSTISHLGLITMLLGLGTKAAATAAIMHIIMHATFKAALFMAAGIVDHATHTRDMRRLGGLRHVMPVTFVIATVASLSMAGVPPLNGFLSKEAMLEQVAHAGWLGFCVIAITMMSVAYSLRFLAGTFLGPSHHDTAHPPHDPGIGLWLAPGLLVALVAVTGLAPMATVVWLVDAAASAVTGVPITAKIALWHGLAAPALWMSLAAFGGGLVLLGLWPALARLWMAARLPDAKRIFDATMDHLTKRARGITDGLHDGNLSRAVAIASLTITATGVFAFATGTHAPGLRNATPTPAVAMVAFVVLLLAIMALLLLHHSRLLALILVSGIGLIVSVTFACLSAPDLALTQITVEVVTVLLMLIALNHLPRTTPHESPLFRRLWHAVVAVAAGTATAALTYALLMRDFAFPAISAFHLAQSKPGAGGTNAVNTIIVDFRGYDTFGEIIVLGIAALVIFALTESILAPGPANDRLMASSPQARRAGDRHPMMLVVATRLMLPIAMMVGVYIFLRGHNLPGGGFVAGLVVAIAYLMQYIASGLAWAEARQRIPYHALVAMGVLVAGLTGMGAWAFGLPFLTSGYDYISLWPFETFELATAALFDLGVFLTVFGAVMLALWSLSRIGLRAGGVVNAQAYDIDPTQGPL